MSIKENTLSYWYIVYLDGGGCYYQYTIKTIQD